MGQEIVHCSKCGSQARGSAVVRVEDRILCAACAPAPAAPAPTTRRQITTRRAPAAAPVLPKKNGVLIGAFVGAAVLLLAMAVLLLSGRSAPPAATPPPEVKKPATAPPPIPPPVDPLLEARAFAKANPDNLEGQAALYQKALEKTRGTDAYDRAREEFNRLQKRMADVPAPKLETAAPPPPPPPVAVAPKPAEPEPAPAPAPPPPTPAPAPTQPPAPPAPAPAPATVFPFVAGSSKWILLEPARMTSSEGAVLKKLDDGSILVSGPNPGQGTHTIAVRTELRTLTGFRLEVFPDPSFPASGPGRAGNGNFVLSEFKVEVAPKPDADSGAPVALADPKAEFSQDQWPVAAALDGKNETGWATAPRFGLPNTAVFETQKPLVGASTLIFRLEHLSVHGQHAIGRFRLSASAVRDPSKDLAAAPPPPPPSIDTARVDKAIQKGVAWLRTAGSPGSHVGNSDELVLWTYLHAGVPESDPAFQDLLKRMLEAPLERTYKVALQAMILEELDRVAHQPRIWQCAQFLVDNQCPNGQWLYGDPTEAVKGVPSGGGSRPPVATASKLDPDGHRIKPKVQRRMAVKKTRDGPAEGDNSNSQYAALGLRACHDAGILLPEDTVLRAVKWWRESQHPDEDKDSGYGGIKGWNYTNLARDAKPAYHAMTAGGTSSLVIYDYILGRAWKKDSWVKSGSNWLAQHFVVDGNYYYLYGLERTGVLAGTETFGRHDWYRLGAKFILDNQNPAGVWGNPAADKPDEKAWNTWNTCFAILFLKRATRPLVASEDTRAPK